MKRYSNKRSLKIDQARVQLEASRNRKQRKHWRAVLARLERLAMG